MFQNITIGRTGFLTAIDEQDGTVLSFMGREDIESNPVDVLGIRFEGKKQTASFEEFQEAFARPNQVVKIELDGEDYYAVRLNVEHVIILALQPLKEIRNTVRSAMSMRLILLLLASGICVLYCFFFLEDSLVSLSESSAETSSGNPAVPARTSAGIQGKKGRIVTWNTVLSYKTLFPVILLLIAVFLSDLLLEQIILYADDYRYSNSKALNAEMLYTSHTEARDELSRWTADEYLARAEIIENITGQAAPEDITDEYLQTLALALDIENIYVYDITGSIIATNSPYNQTVLGKSDPFYALLEGRSQLTLEPEWDEERGRFIQKAGVPRMDQNNKCIGIVIITGEVPEIFDTMNRLEYLDVFELNAMKSETSILIINDTTDLIEYSAQVKDSGYTAGMGLFDYKGYPVSSLKLDEEKLYNNYNGSLNLINTRYFATIHRTGDYFFIILRSRIRIVGDVLMQALIISCIAFALLLLVIIVSCLHFHTDPAALRETQLQDTQGSPAAEVYNEQESSNTLDPSDTAKTLENPVATLLDRILVRRKPGFKERWPYDCTRWHKKNTG